MTAPIITRPGESLQRLRRVYRTFTDQHGRQMEAQADAMNQQPIGEFTPRGCNPPWLPPMRFASWRQIGDLQFRWRYEDMASELAADTAQYYKDARTLALREKLSVPEMGGVVDSLIRDVLGRPPLSPAIPLACEQGDPWMLGIPGAPVNVALKEILEQGVGASSKEALDIIRASLNQMVAAGTIQPIAKVQMPEVKPDIPKRVDGPPSLEEMPEITYRDFVRECRGRKMSLADIGEAWKAHKEAWATNATSTMPLRG